MADSNYRVLHIGSGRYAPGDRGHSTYGIWSELAKGFQSYHVIARSIGAAAAWRDGNLKITLLSSQLAREAEFLATQFRAVPIGIRYAPDVIVCQAPTMGGLAAAIIARRTGAKLLMEMHSDVYVNPARIGSRDWLLQRLGAPSLTYATRIRVLSSGMAQRFLQLYVTKFRQRLRVLPPRVDVSRFVPKRTHVHGGPLRLITVGTLNSRKGQLKLIDALQDARMPLELHLVGDGPHFRKCQERSLVSKPSLRIVCHGSLEHDKVASLLQESDVFVLYSKSEGTPRAIMEAMAVGLPVVTTNAGFCADIVRHGAEGFVLGPSPDVEIVSILERLHHDRSLLRLLGTAGRSRAEEEYDSEKLFSAYRQLIAETAAT